MTISAIPERALAGSLAAELARAPLDRVPAGTLVSVTIATPWQEPLAWFDAASRLGEDSALWLTDDGQVVVGIGVAWRVDLVGDQRFREAGRRWERLIAGARTFGSASGVEGAGPLLIGGATFAPTRSRDARWRGFEDGHLDLPSLILRATPHGPLLCASLVVSGPDEARSAARMLVQRLRIIEDALWQGPVRGGPRPLPRLRSTSTCPEQDAWSAAVARAAGAVGRGRLDKVVLARRLDVEAEADLDAVSILARMAAPDDPTLAPRTRFAFHAAGRTFLGATPECLVAGDGRGIRTVALAGTTGRGADAASDAELGAALLASEKDREEHAVVVDMLRATLAGAVGDLEVEDMPHLLRLPSLQHLATDMRATLPAHTGVLDMVQLLHPTPAVGGWPREAALELIAEQEGIDRGWYAGPVGWLDAAGRGCFMVAIRSCVVEGPHATLFAGCGIVGDSDPAEEWQESGLKIGATLRALGEWRS